MRRHVARHLHRDGNHARVAAYSRQLERAFSDWVGGVDTRGYSAADLVTRLDAAAQEAFPRAFAAGRYQAYPKRRPSGDGEQVLRTKLLSNRFYLQNSLQADVDARVALWRKNPQGTLSEALRRSFESRVRDGYGGAIWQVQEGGYRAGVREATRDLAIRLTGRIQAEEGDDEEQPGDAGLALALGLTLGGLLLLISAFRGTPSTPPGGPGETQMVPLPGVLEASGVRVGTQYNAENDDSTCDPCAENASGGEEGDGIYWDLDPPLPGEDCLGSTRCRCELATVTDLPDIAGLTEAA